MNRPVSLSARPSVSLLVCCAALALLIPGCAEMNRLRTETDQQNREIAQLTQERDQFKKAYYDVVQIREKESREASALRDQLERDKENLQGELALQKDQADAEKQKLQAELDKEKADRQKTEKGLQDLVDALRGEMAKLQESANELQSNVNTLQARAEAAETAGKQAETDRDLARKELETLRQQEAASEQKIAAVEKQITEANATVETQKNTIAERDRSLAEQKSAIQVLNQELIKARTQTLKAPTNPDESTTTHPAQEASPPPSTAFPPDKADALAAQMAKAMEEGKVPKSEYAVSKDPRGVVVRLSSDWLFQSQSVLLSDDATKSLAPLARALQEDPNLHIRVEGHTDSTPVRNMPFPDNWGIASARADAVVRWLESDGKISGKRLTAIGRSRFDPLGDNSTPEGRKKNRRVELWLAPERR